MLDDLVVFKKKLGKRIAQLRERKGLTQAQLAALINKDFQSLSRIENGKVNPSVYIVKQIAMALEVELNALFEND